MFLEKGEEVTGFLQDSAIEGWLWMAFGGTALVPGDTWLRCLLALGAHSIPC